jgi:peptidoglycan/xylan/chitin deacetylase (PgdA/CDA1 family)
VVALRKRGHIIGSHSHSHPPRISACTREELNREWGESVRTLEHLLGEPVTTASIPGGYYSRSVATAAARAGIRLLFTSEPVTSTHLLGGCTLTGRFTVQQGVSASWVGAVMAGEIRPRLQRYLFWNGKKVLKGMVGPGWLSLRRRILTSKDQGCARSPR